MTDDPTCKVCGHRASSHRYGAPPVCAKCPDHVCQDGPDGRRYREKSA